MFEERYSYFPGDLPNALDYWPGCNASSTCNGNGDGILSSTGAETVQAWQHLGLAKMIPGEYAGAGGINASPLLYTSDLFSAPEAPVGGVTGGGNFYGFQGDDELGAANACSCHPASNAVFGKRGKRIILSAGWYNLRMFSLIPSDAAAIDRKNDDGVAYSGNIRATTGHIIYQVAKAQEHAV